MLNPSTADAEQDDPTIRRCKAFAKRQGATELVVANLFAYRTPSPTTLETSVKSIDVVGPENDKYLNKAMHDCYQMPIVAAWGANKLAKLRVVGDSFVSHLYCLGKTKNGHPRHPLYVRANQELIKFL